MCPVLLGMGSNTPMTMPRVRGWMMDGQMVGWKDNLIQILRFVERHRLEGRGHWAHSNIPRLLPRVYPALCLVFTSIVSGSRMDEYPLEHSQVSHLKWKACRAIYNLLQMGEKSICHRSHQRPAETTLKERVLCLVWKTVQWSSIAQIWMEEMERTKLKYLLIL